MTHKPDPTFAAAVDSGCAPTTFPIAKPGFAVSRQTVRNWWRFQTLAANGFQACVYAAAVDCGASSTARICLGTDMPKVFSIADSSAAIFVR